ncbi:hypothetical protein U1Q18_010731 [Sarracenia purpurea var. burkii]
MRNGRLQGCLLHRKCAELKSGISDLRSSIEAGEAVGDDQEVATDGGVCSNHRFLVFGSELRNRSWEFRFPASDYKLRNRFPASGFGPGSDFQRRWLLVVRSLISDVNGF